MMKNWFSASALLGLMFVLSGSAFAQSGVVINVDGSGKLPIKVGQNIHFQVHSPISDNKELGIKAGAKICMVLVRNGGQAASILVNADCSGKKLFQGIHPMKAVGGESGFNIFIGDTVQLNQSSRMLTVTRKGKPASNATITF